MPETRQAAETEFDAAQAAELALLLDLEARWENLRAARPGTEAAPPALQNLQGKQRAYDAFRARLRVYNRRHAPAHVPELLLNTPARLAKWCRQMRDLHARVGQPPQSYCPDHLLEKAYRWADRLAGKMGKDRVSRAAQPGTVEAVIRDFEALAGWCDDLTPAP